MTCGGPFTFCVTCRKLRRLPAASLDTVARVIARLQVDFSEIGWDAAVAIGTGVLAISTGVLAAYTARLAKKTSDMAEEEREEAKARTRPVLMPPAEAKAAISQINSDTEPVALRLSVMNAGVGPALNAYAWVIVATSAGLHRSRLVPVGSIAPGYGADIAIADVPASDTGAVEHNAYLAAYVTLVYGDLGGRSYHSVVGLLDPERGLPIGTTPGYVVRPRMLDVSGTEVGEGDAPPPQWRVQFAGPQVSDDQRNRLAAANVILLVATADVATTSPEQPFKMPTTMQWVAFASGATDAEANERVRSALSDERYQAFTASLWTRGRLVVESPDRET